MITVPPKTTSITLSKKKYAVHITQYTVNSTQYTVHCNAVQCSVLSYCLYHGQFPAEYRVLSSEAQVPVLDQAVYRESSIPGTPPESQSRQGWSYLILGWETKSGKSLGPSPCIIGPQEGKSPLLDTCKKHYSPEITCTRSGPKMYPTMQQCSK